MAIRRGLKRSSQSTLDSYFQLSSSSSKRPFENGSVLQTQITTEATLPSKSEPLMYKFRLVDGKPSKAPSKEQIADNNEIYVVMPHSHENKFIIRSGSEEKISSRWDVVVKSLNDLLEKNYRNSEDIEIAVQKYHSSANDFSGLHSFFSSIAVEEAIDIYENILPKIILLVLRTKNICTEPIPLLTKQRNCSVNISQHQAACLLANAFFCTFSNKYRKKYPIFNFFGLFKKSMDDKRHSQHAKLRCIFNYFKRRQLDCNVPDGILTIERQGFRGKSSREWCESGSKLSQLNVSSHGLIEKDGVGMLQVDFANKYLGGGVLRSGCVQEEIRFLVCPEAIVSCLLAEELDDNECIFILGCEQYNDYSGYSQSFRWEGNFEDHSPRDSLGRRMTEIVAIDALPVRSFGQQFDEKSLLREVNKAYCGFFKPNVEHLPPVATGNWGCGAFGGDPQLKALIQMMSASEAGRDVHYFTFGDAEFAERLTELHRDLTFHQSSVGFLWRHISEFGELVRSCGAGGLDLFNYIQECIITE